MPLEPAPAFADGPCDCGTFFLDLTGPLARRDVAVAWTPAPRPTNHVVEALIDRAWDQQTRLARRDGRLLFNGPMCRLASWAARPGRLELTLGPVSFREFVGTNLTQPQIRYTHGPEVLADPVGASAALVTDDGFLLLGRRSGTVMQYGGCLHPVGGTLCPPARDNGPPDPFETAVDEIVEELGLPRPDIAPPVCLGMVRDKNTMQPEMIFGVKVAREVSGVVEAMSRAPDAHEHAGLVPLPDHPGAVVAFLEQHAGELTPVAVAALLLHGLWRWGGGWFASARGHLGSVV